MVKEIIVSLKQQLKVFPSLVAIVIIQTAIGGMRAIPSTIIGIVYFLSMIICIKSDSFKIDKKWLIFLLYLPITIIIGRPHEVFNSWNRLIMFCLMYISVSSLIQSNYARRFRKCIFNMAILLCIIISYLSFAGYFLGINLFSPDGYEDVNYVGVAGLFSGITKQSMLLGPISGLATIYLFSKAIENKKSIISWLMILPSMGCVLFSASRSAFIATIGGIIVVLYNKFTRKSEFIKYIIIIGIFALLTFPMWQSATTALQNKQAIHKDDTSRFDSRTDKVDARISEFVSSPIFGIGFAAVDYYGKDGFNKVKGTIEPGTSWLAILSMTGLIGFILFLNIFIDSFIRIRKNNLQVWLVGMFAFFAIHMLVEGYIYAGGSVLAFLLWLILGQCYDSINYIEIKPYTYRYENNRIIK